MQCLYIVGRVTSPLYVTPLFTPGVEYRTTERWNGQVVYVKRIPCRSVPNTGNVNIGGLTPNMNIVDFNAVLMKSGITIKLPYMDSTGKCTARAHCLQSSSVIQLQTFTDMSSYTGYVVIKYTKS